MKLKAYLPIIGIAIFAYLIYKIHPANIIGEIAKANLFFLLMAVLLVLASMISTTAKWFCIARYQNINVPFTSALRINFISGFYGFVTPSKIGSLIRVNYLKKFNNDKIGKAVSNFILEKIMDLVSLMVLVLISSIFIGKIISPNYPHYALAVLFIALIGLIIVIDRERSKKLLGWIYFYFIPKKLKGAAAEGFNSFHEDMPKTRHFFLFFLITSINWIIIYSIFYFIGLSVGINVSIFYFLLFMPLVTFIGQIPITINGLGTREAAMISLFGLLDISATKIFSMSLINLVINGIVPAIIGMILALSIEKKNLAS